MKRLKIKSYSKINLTLDVLGVSQGYHDIQSLIASIDLFDAITLVKTNDGVITLKNIGINPQCDIENNNAYKGAKAYIERLKQIDATVYENAGVKITINKKIPVGGGLGGSSADLVGVLKGMDILYGGVDIDRLCATLSSDAPFMLKGGVAKIYGRGEKIEWINKIPTLYLIILNAQKTLLAKDAYYEFDRISAQKQGGVGEDYTYTEKALKNIKEGNILGLLENLHNDLEQPCFNLLPEILQNKNVLKDFGHTLMTGSGSSVYSVFLDKRQRDLAYKRLKKQKNLNLIKAQTL